MIYILVYDKKFIMVEIYWVLCQPLTMYYNSLILHLLRPVKKAYPGRGQSSLRQGNLRCLGMLALSSLFSTLLFLFSLITNLWLLSCVAFMTCCRHTLGDYNTGLVC